MKKIKWVFYDKSRPKGKWLWRLSDNGWADNICSHCGLRWNDDVDTVVDWRYCPNCGAEMQNGKKYKFITGNG